MANILPTLSTTGWLKNPKQILSTMLVNALLANYSQSNIYRGNIVSLPYLAATYQNNPSIMVTETEAVLKQYYERMFSVVTVEASFQTHSTDDSKYDLYINISVIDNGNSYSLATVASVDNGVIQVLKELNA